MINKLRAAGYPVMVLGAEYYNFLVFKKAERMLSQKPIGKT